MDIFENESENYFEQLITDSNSRSRRLEMHLPKVMHNHNEFTEACFAEGKVSQKQKQLTALAISIYAQDEYSIIHHTRLSMDLGATEEEIVEMIAVSAALGHANLSSEGVTLALDTFDYFNQEMH